MQILPLSTPVTAEEVCQSALRKLRDSPYFFLKQLDCRFQDGRLTLRGSVPYVQLRSIAESIVSRVPGVEEVVNRIDVVDPVLGTTARAVRNAG